MALATAAALHDLRALIFGNDALNLQQQIVFRTLADRLIEKDHLDAVASPLIQENDLIGAAGQAIRSLQADRAQ